MEEMNRQRIINRIVKKNGALSYLEIGVGDNTNFKSIKAIYKVSVDPNQKSTFQVTSDEYFAGNGAHFDVIFIDGLHLSEQVYKDIINSLNCLQAGGVIVCHDMSPVQEEDQVREHTPGKTWNGDVWKAWVTLRKERDDLEMYVIDCDCGCGIITKGEQDLLVTDLPLTFKNLDENRKEWLNLKSVEEIEWLE
tara:strand:+ start:3299 stop:3877 length:579 start_codon:yes stop_codon:yes gene_type:complete